VRRCAGHLEGAPPTRQKETFRPRPQGRLAHLSGFHRVGEVESLHHTAVNCMINGQSDYRPYDRHNQAIYV